MDIKAYIESGILELYALGVLNAAEKADVERVITACPELKNELDSIHAAIEKYAASSAISPPPELKDKIKRTISDLEKEKNMHLSDLPLISKFSDYRQWLRIVEEYIPQRLEGGKFIKVLRNTEDLTQMLLVSSTEFEDETHDDLHESFLILEGQCKCTVGEDVFYMSAGEYTEIPLHAVHKVEMVTPRVVAILQRIAV